MNKAIQILSYIGKFAGLIVGLGEIPFVDPKTGLIVFAIASLLKDTANRTKEILEKTDK